MSKLEQFLAETWYGSLIAGIFLLLIYRSIYVLLCGATHVWEDYMLGALTGITVVALERLACKRIRQYQQKEIYNV